MQMFPRSIILMTLSVQYFKEINFQQGKKRGKKRKCKDILKGLSLN